MEEEWKAVPGYEGSYEALNIGGVRSLDRVDPRGNHIKGRVLAPSKLRNGYLAVSLYKNGVPHNHPIHELVLETFVGPRPEGMEVCHLDGNPYNNTVENLRWDTHAGNMQDMVSHGRTNLGRGLSQATLTEADIPRIFELRASGMKVTEIADAIGVHRGTVYGILSRKRWNHVAVDRDLVLKIRTRCKKTS
jgi:hypothetical protein